jgi:hypothetical protein
MCPRRRHQLVPRSKPRARSDRAAGVSARAKNGSIRCAPRIRARELPGASGGNRRFAWRAAVSAGQAAATTGSGYYVNGACGLARKGAPLRMETSGLPGASAAAVVVMSGSNNFARPGMSPASNRPMASRTTSTFSSDIVHAVSRDGELSFCLALAHAWWLGSWPLRTMPQTIIPQVTAHPAAGMSAQAPAPTTTRRTVSAAKTPQSHMCEWFIAPPSRICTRG